MSSVKITQTSHTSEDMELSDEMLEVVAGGSNDATINQTGIASNSGVGTAVSDQTASISQVEKKLHFGSSPSSY